MVITRVLKGRFASLLFVLLFSTALTVAFFPVQLLKLEKSYADSNRAYRITDSLPDLSLSIRRFEAFRMYDSGSHKSNSDGSVSYSPDLTRILKLEYVSASQKMDSVVIIDFIEDSIPSRNKFEAKDGNFIQMRFVDHLKSKLHTQAHFALICSYPRPIKRYFPGLVHSFEPIEGSQVKQVGFFFPLQWKKKRKADTLYPTNSENVELEIFSKKNDIAIINGLEEEKCISIYAGTNGWFSANVPRNSIAIFRDVISGNDRYSIAIAQNRTIKDFLLRKNDVYSYFYMSK